MSTWIYGSEQNPRGPVTFNRLAQLLAAGHVQDGDLVCRQGSEHWEQAGDVIGLKRRASELQSHSRRGTPDCSQSPAVKARTVPDRHPPGAAAIDDLIRQTRERLHEAPPQAVTDRRAILAFWLPLGVVGTIVGSSIVYSMLSDPFARKSFEGG